MICYGNWTWEHATRLLSTASGQRRITNTGFAETRTVESVRLVDANMLTITLKMCNSRSGRGFGIQVIDGCRSTVHRRRDRHPERSTYR
jgi:hypothetical protein